MHLLMPLRICVIGFGNHPRRSRHRLDAAGNAHIGITHGNLSARRHNRLEARAAEPILRHSGNRSGQTGQQRSHAGHVAILFAGAVPVSEMDVVDAYWHEVGRPLQQRFDDFSRQIVRADLCECAADAADRRPHGIDDEDVLVHAGSSIVSRITSLRRTGKNCMGRHRWSSP